MLSDKQKNSFLNKIKKLSQALDALKTENTLQELDRFENQLTLNELRECFSNTTSESCEVKLTRLLAQRWERIRGSSMCYTQKPFNLVNQLCLEFATTLSPPITTPSEIEALKPNTGPYCLLMPSLENSVDVYGVNIHSLQLHEFVLSDRERVFIPLLSCLHQATISDEGRLRHMVEIDKGYPELTPSEMKRVSEHSWETRDLYQYILELNAERLCSEDIGTKLSQLAAALRKGGTHHGGSGTEKNAGAEANLGILIFNKYWNELSEPQRAAIFKKTPKLRDIIGRLFRPKDVNYQQTRFCVGLLANELDPIIEVYNKRPSIKELQRRVDAREVVLRSHFKESRFYLLMNQNSRPPKHILHLIFKLSAVEQQKIFKWDGYENALEYAIANEPEALSEFELDSAFKKQAISIRVKPNYDSGLILAAKRGEINAIKLLLDWGSDMELPDLTGSRALHWAANNGHVDTVNYLLERGALLEARGAGNNTALNFAVRHGQGIVVTRLLKENADLNARNNEGLNALDLAIKCHNELIEPILMQMATLPADKQAECLLNEPEDPNVFFYAADIHKPSLLAALITVALEKRKISSTDPLLTATNERGFTPLLLAAEQGITEGVRKLVDLGVDIESSSLDGRKALHWAAGAGHVEVVNFLLDRGALLEARGFGNNTAFNFAVMRGREIVVKRLLKENVDLNARNNKGLNALDLAIKCHPELVEPILMQMATLPADKQAECLQNVPEGPYQNVFFYAAAHKPSLFAALISAALERKVSSDALLTTANQKGYTPLLLAAQQGLTESIRKLVALRVDIESCDLNGSTALHWAANNGHVDSVNYLLEHGALLEARGSENNTALNFAVWHGQGIVVTRLLKDNADVNARNKQGLNALDIAITKHDKLVEPILMQMATLPADKQAECLQNVPEGPYQNVFFYAAAHKPSLFAALISAALERKVTSSDALLTTANQKGYTPLLLAAQQGLTESVRKLVDLGVGIESHDLNGSTALHWAANNDHVDTVNYLLERGALLEARGAENNTALNFAVMHGQETVVKRLLKENGYVNARNKQGLNALDIAMTKHDKLVEPIVMKIATLPVDKQADCLANVPGGPYPNVLFYIATEKTKLLGPLLHSFNKSDLDSKMQPILEHVHQIGLHYQKMKSKSFDNRNYEAAVSAAEILLKTCTDEALKVYQSCDNTDVKMFEFKKSCAEAIETARPVLREYREWGKVLQAFLLAVITLPISLPLYAAGFFSVKTKSEQLLDNLQLDVNKLGQGA